MCICRLRAFHCGTWLVWGFWGILAAFAAFFIGAKLISIMHILPYSYYLVILQEKIHNTESYDEGDTRTPAERQEKLLFRVNIGHLHGSDGGTGGHKEKLAAACRAGGRRLRSQQEGHDKAGRAYKSEE